MKVTSKSPEETERMGAALGRLLAPGDLVCLSGGLGAGKTCLARGIAAGLGIREGIRSPSYTLINEHRGGRIPLYHMDFYRLADPVELEEIGLQDYLEGEGIVLMEWPEAAYQLLPGERLEITLEPVEDREASRRIMAQAAGDRFERLLRDWAGAC
ncbi:MAG: tRNA (adenosine(37)-N6)-threonylcarbamoyltransferase complex ATPase subunit type 1 TsaE [Firmicutes bacterium]|nr:tRNA (adenosine(37)-N6)-threonylcarbamoyltransferase complex ATPase subunit type 1 TsaE [Bacillota bacterium]